MTDLLIEGNTFATKTEAIGFGCGVKLVGDPADYVAHLEETNTFFWFSGGVVDYRVDTCPEEL